jgi:hypothetical protein
MKSRLSVLVAMGTGVVAFAGVALAQAHACTPVTIPTVITSSGVYCVAADAVFGSVHVGAIDVQASGVVVDFAGYRLHWNGTVLANNPAVKIQQTSENVLIRNGLISGFQVGVETLGSGTIIEDMRMNNNDLGVAVRSGAQAVVIRRNLIRMGNGVVIDAGVTGSARIVDNDFHGRTSNAGAAGNNGVQVFGQHAIVSNNRFGRFYQGLWFDAANTVYGKYQGNLTNNVAVPFTGGTDAGDNN